MMINKIMSMLCEKLSCAYVIFNKDLKIIAFSKNVAHVADNPTQMEIGKKIYDPFWAFVGLEDELKKTYDSDTNFSLPLIYKNNTYYNLDIDTIITEDKDKNFIAIFITQTQFTEHYAKLIKNINQRSLVLETKEQEHEQKQTESYHVILNHQLICFHVNPDGTISKINSACTLFFDLPKNEIIGNHFSHFFTSVEPINLDATEGDAHILSAIKPEGDSAYFNAAIMPIYKDGQLDECVIICQDITNLKHTQKQLEYAANHDHLTHLPNRNLLYKKIDEAIDYANKSEFTFALCFIDLDFFKQINDEHGHHVGDLILQYFAKQLNDATRNDDTVARIGGDEFIILINNIENINQLSTAIKRIKSVANAKPLIHEGETINYQFSLGLSRYPQDGTDAIALLSYADKEMYRVKKVHHDKKH